MARAGVPHRLEVISSCPPGYTPPDAHFIPAFIFGPGTKDAIHRPNEYVELALLARCIDLVGAFVRSIGAPP